MGLCPVNQAVAENTAEFTCRISECGRRVGGEWVVERV